MATTTDAPVTTLAEGQPSFDPTSSVQIRSSPRGGGLVLLQDTQLIETLAHYARERIPERVVHAKAAGAWGEFEVTHDISHITSAAFLCGVGKKTKTLLRISTVGGERGSADTVRDVRGWAMKFFTEEGNQDFVFNDLPVFFIRDPIKFPSLNRSHKRNPQTNLADSTMFWEYVSIITTRKESIALCSYLAFVEFQRRFAISTPTVTTLTNCTLPYVLLFPLLISTLDTNNNTAKDGSFKYVKMHFKPDGGIKTLPADEAAKLAGEQPDYLTQDLFDAIERGDFPVWTLYLQVMDPQEAETYRWNIFDMTKVWSHKDYPLQPPSNYFQDIEQAAFSPSAMVPGVAPSADPMLQARMFSYPDAARYRLGVNYTQLPCNAPISPVYSPYLRDGTGSIKGNYGADPVYVRSSLKKIQPGPKINLHEEWVGQVVAYSSEVEDDDFVQARDMWNVLGKEEGQQEILVCNVAGNVKAAIPRVRAETIAMFSRVDAGLGKRIEQKVAELLSE
ncbi:catalase [Coleophoma cylindrospora]|uniref:Catalase n=1 Tax=Coleophoma cylindrospora TaxID=1849047 RepID=A0A3D8QNH5_9HELO|nr:catalase [Coleophoma cylindrospora]